MNKMKILFVSGLSSGGGAERVLSILSNYFVTKGYDVTFSSMYDNGYYEMDNRIKIKVYNNESFLKQIKDIRRFIRNEKFDVVIAFMHPICVKVNLALVGMKNRPVIISSERGDPSKVNDKFKILRNWAYKKSNAVVFQTTMAKDFFGKKIQRKGYIIQNPINNQIPEPYFGERDKRIVSVGRLVEQKNFKMLIKVFSELCIKYDGYVLEIYGEGPLEAELKEYASSLCDVNRIRFCGFSSNLFDDIRKAYMYISTSNFEGISNSMLEAISLGIPSICTDCPVGGARDSIINNVNGILIPINDEKALKENICKLIEDKEFYNKIRDNYKILKDSNSIECIGRKWENLILSYFNEEVI